MLTSPSAVALTAFNSDRLSTKGESTSESPNAKAAVGGKEEAGAANDAAFWLLRFPRLGPLFDSWTRVGSLPSGEQAKLLELLHAASSSASKSSASASSTSTAAAAAESVQFFGKMVVDVLQSIQSFPSQQYVSCALRLAFLPGRLLQACQLVFILNDQGVFLLLFASISRYLLLTMLATSAEQHPDAVRHLAPSVAAALRTALLDFVCIGDCAHPQSEVEWTQQIKRARELEAERQQREAKRVERAAKRVERKKKATLHVQSTSGHFSCQCGMGGPSPQTGPTYCVKCRLCLTCCGRTPRCSAASALVVSDDEDEDESVDDKAKAAPATGGDETLSAVPSAVRVATDLLFRLAPFSGAAAAEIATRFAAAASTADAPAIASSAPVAAAAAGSIAASASRLVDTRPNLLRIVDLFSADSEKATVDSKPSAVDSQPDAIDKVARSLADTLAAQLLDSISQVAAKLDAAAEMDAAFRALVAAVAHRTLALRVSNSESDASVGAETALLVALNRVLALIRDPNAPPLPSFSFPPTTAGVPSMFSFSAAAVNAPSAASSATWMENMLKPDQSKAKFKCTSSAVDAVSKGLDSAMGAIASKTRTYASFHHHALSTANLPIGRHTCDSCHTKITTASSWRCAPCDIDLCLACESKLGGKVETRAKATAAVEAPPPPPTIGSLAAAATADHVLLSCVRRVCAHAIAAAVAHCVRMLDVLRQSEVNSSSGTRKRSFLSSYTHLYKFYISGRMVSPQQHSHSVFRRIIQLTFALGFAPYWLYQMQPSLICFDTSTVCRPRRRLSPITPIRPHPPRRMARRPPWHCSLSAC